MGPPSAVPLRRRLMMSATATDHTAVSNECHSLLLSEQMCSWSFLSEISNAGPTATMETDDCGQWNSLPLYLRQTNIDFELLKGLLKKFVFGC